MFLKQKSKADLETFGFFIEQMRNKTNIKILWNALSGMSYKFKLYDANQQIELRMGCKRRYDKTCTWWFECDIAEYRGWGRKWG